VERSLPLQSRLCEHGSPGALIERYVVDERQNLYERQQSTWGDGSSDNRLPTKLYSRLAQLLKLPYRSVKTHGAPVQPQRPMTPSIRVSWMQLLSVKFTSGLATGYSRGQSCWDRLHWKERGIVGVGEYQKQNHERLSSNADHERLYLDADFIEHPDPRFILGPRA
jgi:hypothetical protein